MQRFKYMFALLGFLVISMPVLAQLHQKPLDHSVYDGWKGISRSMLSDDGRWAAYEVNPQVGDGWLYLVNLRNNHTDSMPRGTRATFSPEIRYLAYLVQPETSVVRQARVEGLRRHEMPANQLAIKMLHGEQAYLFDNIQSFSVPRGGSEWMVFHKNEHPDHPDLHKTLVIMNPHHPSEHRFPLVEDYAMATKSSRFAFSQKDDSTGMMALNIFSAENQQVTEIFSKNGKISGLVMDEPGDQVSFLYTEEDKQGAELYYWNDSMETARPVVSRQTPGMPDGYSTSTFASPAFSQNGRKIFFGTAPLPQPTPEDTLMDHEKHRLDLWHYKDPLIQPMQLVERRQELERTFTALFHIDSGQLIQLADENMPDVTTRQYGNGQWEMGESQLPYLIPNSFESGDYRDVFLVDVNTGQRELILEKHRGSVHRSTTGDPRLSPGGNHLLYYNQEDRNWYAMSLSTRQHVNLTAGIAHPIYDELHDSPSEPDPYGIAGWVEDDRYVLIYDRFDIWLADPNGREAPVALTNGYGRQNNTRLRLVNLDTEQTHIGRRDQIMLSAFHLYNKQSGFYTLRMHRPGNPDRVVMDDVRYFTPTKARNADVFMWQKSTFEMFPDLWVGDMTLRQGRRISVANPQQADYSWGSVKLVEWVSFANDSLQGLLYMPDNMEPGKKYPMIVFFYERSSDGLHTHQVPAPSRSTINRSYCVSNGYIVFMTDIPYTIGYPGQSAYNAIVSGTKAMVNQFDFIDRHNIGIQGQSWAGYQIAWLITQTDLFKAAMAGAPVSNMISAYGGIRWATGMSRIYQYEQTQSRIGGTIWNETLRYIENSPIFFADKVNTPLLMMHNDADGAVPWYQGIEYFMALRRLDKPVWMLNYNDEAHNLTRRPNMMDLSVRMYQFFDYYLKGAPAPRWMEDGIPAVLKGIENRYELME